MFKTLAQCGFVIGDYLDISITPPGSAARGMMSLDRMAGDRDHRGLGGGRNDRYVIGYIYKYEAIFSSYTTLK